MGGDFVRKKTVNKWLFGKHGELFWFSLLEDRIKLFSRHSVLKSDEGPGAEVGVAPPPGIPCACGGLAMCDSIMAQTLPGCSLLCHRIEEALWRASAGKHPLRSLSASAQPAAVQLPHTEDSGVPEQNISTRAGSKLTLVAV